LALRLRVVEQAMTGGVSLGKLSRLFGPSVTAIVNWVSAYEKGNRDDGPIAGSGQWHLAGTSACERSDAAPEEGQSDEADPRRTI
jgi:transposase-like protein